MNDTTLTQLKVLVERAVRPVRASTFRKRKMREELLAHLTEVYEVERTTLGEERAALERTAQRFGNPAELTGQFQDSVPASDSIGRFFEHLWLRPGESTLRRAVRYALLMLLLPGGFLLIAFFIQGRLLEWPIVLAIGLAAFTCPFLAQWIWDAFYGPAGRSWPRAILVAAAAALLVPGMTFALCLTFSRDVSASLSDALSIAPVAAVLTPFLLLSFANMAAPGIRYHQEWASLQID